MKTTVVLGLIIFSSLLSCKKDTTGQPEINSEAKIKKKLFYDYIEDTIPRGINEYQYDNEMKLERIYHYSGSCPDTSYIYELFEYGMDNEIADKFTYHYANDSLGWLLHDSTHYVYDKGKLILEEIYYFTSSFDKVLFKYEYENSNLKKKYEYYNHQLKNFTVYGYSGGLCVKETKYKALSTDIFNYTIHHYENDMLTKSEKYSGKNIKIQTIAYIYDEKGNLAVEESKQVDFTVVKQLFYVVKYEYY